VLGRRSFSIVGIVECVTKQFLTSIRVEGHDVIRMRFAQLKFKMFEPCDKVILAILRCLNHVILAILRCFKADSNIELY